MTETNLPIRLSVCPICAATDAFIDTFREGHEYYVECVNCHVYRASRRTFRFFEYLRAKGDVPSLDRLGRLAAVLNKRGRGAAIQLEYDTWESLIEQEADSAPC